MKKSRKIWMQLVIILCLSLSMAISVQAATPSKTKQKSMYSSFIKNKTVTVKRSPTFKQKFTIDAFILLDINKDGVYELITTDYKANSKYKCVYNNVFTIKKGKIVYFDSFYNSTELHGTQRKVYHNSKMKGLVGEGYIYHGKCNILFLMKNQGFMMHDAKYVGNKPAKSLTTNIKAYTYRANTPNNRAKYL